MRAWYNVDTRKALETILWFANRRDPIDFYHVLKILFFADKKHLNDYGRPVLGDTYDALRHGPVARTVYSLMKHDDPLEQIFLAETLGLQEEYPIMVRNSYWISALRKPDLSYFSESDLEALEWAFAKYSQKSFNELECLTHAEKAWRNARENGGPMKYEDMLEGGGNAVMAMRRHIALGAPQAIF